MNNSQQPGKYDAVLGRQSQTPEGAAVLGGIDGVQLRLSNPNSQVRITELTQALNYGEQGLDLVIEALKNEFVEVQYAAYSLLKSRTEAKVKQALIIFNQANFKSAVGQDYTRLREFLAAEEWKEADQETRWVMLAVAKREKEGWLEVEDINNFPCEDLRTIDKLWVKYSNGRFGFSVQKRIYEGYSGMKKYDLVKFRCQLGDAIGWRKGGKWLRYKDITFDKKSPEGNLPWVGRFLINRVDYLFSRVETCKL